MSAFLGLLGLQLAGAVVVTVLERQPLLDALRRPSSLFVALLGLGCASLGWPGLVVGAVAAVATWRAPRIAEAVVTGRAWLVIGALLVVILARPWVPLYWDELVWLAKARLTTGAFLSGVAEASLDPTAGVLPAGYVPLWPAAVGWLTLGVDSVPAQTLAGSLLVAACFAAALESWWPVIARARAWALVPLLGAPLVLVHLRAVYVDLPVGLLAVALLGRLLDGRAGIASVALALALAGFKDEGITHVLVASLVAFLFGPLRWRGLGPLVTAGAFVVVWRLALAASGVRVVDHAIDTPAVTWAPTLFRLLIEHATELFSWGVTWTVGALTLGWRSGDLRGRALKLTLLANLGVLVLLVLLGPERVRAFAENGTLLNRLLLQSWPVAALLLVTHVAQAGVPAEPTADRA